tara:strand:+ start:408 stop:1058 length:651 start_codon:yes stop_codon:yes gene_type:complete
VKRLQAKYKRLLLELEFLYEDLEYHEDVFEEAKREFQKSLFAYCDENGINYENDIIKEEERQVKVSDPDKVIFRDRDGNASDEEMLEQVKKLEKQQKPDEIRKLFKKIATKTHPDKFSNAKNAEKAINRQIFMQAKGAAEEHNYFKLQQIARRLGLDLPQIDPKRLKLMEKEAKRIKVKVLRIQKTAAWQWFDEESDKEQKKLMSRYVKSLLRKSN